MFVLAGILFLVVYGLLVFYIGRSGWSWMKPVVSARFRWFYIVALVFLAISFILARLFGSISFLSVIGSYWLAIFSLLLLILPVVHLTLWLLRLTRIPRHYAHKWAGVVTLVLLLSTLGYGIYNAYSPVVRQYSIQIDKKVEGVDSLNIVMAADMHFGLLSGPAHAKRMVEEINALKPDLVLYPGDIIDDNLDMYLKSGIADIISGIQAPYGVYASLGNHDKYNGPIEDLIAALEKSNMQVLYDDKVTLDDKITLIGRKDRTEKDRAEVATLMQDTDLSKPVLMMDHQPYDLDIAEQNHVDLVVSGHTHRGQIAPAQFITKAIYENDWGYLQKGSMHSIVTSGFGFWGPPIRTSSRSEIVQIHVTFQQ
ncbi:metallophosphoesterase [Paenibacillus taichungensis]|uniref:metallophosphoesterase n=1 Tax=Paenibacillus taichungensis TaxID=484184 RepID=UPI00287189B2|nr:metallophosphoesterase [Paenibacillus taichungensis]MDR9746654.1 metallophosphoesterase [Paenibacillus taichungensis]